MFRSFKLLLGILFISIIMVGCTQSKTVQQDLPKVKLGILPVVDTLPLILADDKGYFKQEGVDVELVTFRSALEMDSALQAKKIDGALGDLLYVASLNNREIPTQVVSLVLGKTGHEGRFAILAAPNSGINELSQLKGVEISISYNSIIEYITDRLLQDNGFKPEEVVKGSLPNIPIRFQALINGQIKAACLPDPLAALAESKGAKILVDDTKANLSQTVLYFREDVLNDKGDAVEKILKGYSKATEEINAEPSAYQSLLVERAGVPEEALKVYDGEHYSLPQIPRKKEVERVLQWMVEKKLLKEKIPYDDMVTGKYLPES